MGVDTKAIIRKGTMPEAILSAMAEKYKTADALIEALKQNKQDDATN